jgi:hypothetical protein
MADSLRMVSLVHPGGLRHSTLARLGEPGSDMWYTTRQVHQQLVPEVSWSTFYWALHMPEHEPCMRIATSAERRRLWRAGAIPRKANKVGLATHETVRKALVHLLVPPVVIQGFNSMNTAEGMEPSPLSVQYQQGQLVPRPLAYCPVIQSN